MPRKPMHPCSVPGCPNLTYGRFCEKHTKEDNRNYETYQRDKDVKVKYGRNWKLIRDKYMETHPFCERCFKNGVLVKAEHVHHKVPLNDGGSNEVENLEALCKPCHSKEHALHGDRWHKNKVYTY